jgi:hypothetical protein
VALEHADLGADAIGREDAAHEGHAGAVGPLVAQIDQPLAQRRHAGPDQPNCGPGRQREATGDHDLVEPGGRAGPVGRVDSGAFCC